MVWRYVQKVIGGLDVEIVWKCFSKSHCEYVELLVNGKREQGMYAFSHAAALNCFNQYLESVEDLM